MKVSSKLNYGNRSALLLLAAAAIITAFVFRFETHTAASKGLVVRTEAQVAELPDYDIRSDKSAIETVAGMRQVTGLSAFKVADLRDVFVKGEAKLRRSVPTLRVDYNTDIVTPEVIGPDVQKGRAVLTKASSAKRSEILRDFLKDNANLIGINSAQADDLKLFADASDPDGNLSFVELDQEINGIPVFRGEVKAGFTKDGEIVRVINNLAPGIDPAAVSSDFGDSLSAVQSAAGYINNDASKLDLSRNESLTSETRTTFGKGDSATTAEKMYFPTEPGVAVPAWRVLIWQPVNAFYVIVDARSGTMLWRKNITDDQSQASTYRVYTNSSAMVNVADSPFPYTLSGQPGPLNINGSQGTLLNPVNVSRIGNEAPYTFNENGWIPDGITVTDGNAVQAGLDRDGVDGVDQNGEAISPTRNFTGSFSPFNPNTNTGDEPVPTTQTWPGSAYQQGSITQLFYICNYFHDETYRLGFNEQNRNFQDNNFLNGGVAGDRLRAEAQDSSGVNNANFSTAADGTRGRMQMYLWTGASPRIDGDLDATVVMHELTHGLSNRLHGNSSGLSINMSKGLGEGWSDFYAASLLSQLNDPINGIYTIGGYDTYKGFAGFTSNYFYGIRRFPLAVKAFTGANGKPYNPLTFGDVDQTTLDVSDGAFNRGPYGSGTADEVHNLGEIWASALWEVRAKMITRTGWAAGNRRALQLATDGMKLSPLAPTFVSARDAMIVAAQNGGVAGDVADVWSGFAIRGLGYSASVQQLGSGNGDARVTEAFDLPNLYQTPDITVTDPTGNNNGFPEPGEPVTLTIPLSNSTGNAATGVTLQMVGGGSATYGTIANGAAVSRSVAFTVPAGSTCGGTITVTFNINSSLGPATFTRTIVVGALTENMAETFDTVTVPNFPSQWFATSRYLPIAFKTVAGDAFSGTNSAFAADLPSCASGCPATEGGDTDLTSRAVFISAAAAQLSFWHKFNTEPTWDGGVLEISIGNNGSYVDISDAGGTFLQNGYTGALSTPGPGGTTTNPLAGRNAWWGNSNGYIKTTVRLPPSAAGQMVRFRWRFGTDASVAPANGGWNIDSVQVLGNYVCTFAPSIHFAVSAPPTATTGTAFNFTVTAQDQLNNTVPSYSGTMHFTSTDGSATLPGDIALTNGIGNFSATMMTPGTRTITGTDTNTQVTGTSNGINVQSPVVTGIKPRADFDGDNKSDVSVYRPSDGNWYINRSTAGFVSLHFGISTDIPTPGDFDGDGKADTAVWRPSNGTWYRQNSSDGTGSAIQFGTANDIPQAADFDGDGKTDIAVWRPSSGTWFWINSSNSQVNGVQFGQNGDLPVVGDYDGDSKADLAVYRPSNGTWYRMNSLTSQFIAVPFGLSTDLPVPADYDGDGKLDVAVFRPSDGTWYRLNSGNGQFVAVQFGTNQDVPVPGDYDGDGKYDIAVFRSGTWYLNGSTAGFSAVSFGVGSDVPIQKKYIP